ncbi:MAG: ribosomal protein S18-alanine N-acetyltransferase [Halobacteriaceae archaeon]
MAGSAPAAVEIRGAERADLLEISRIEEASFPQPWSFSAFERFLGEPGFLAALDRGRDRPTVIGYIVADTIPQHRTPVGHVKDIAVHPEHRGAGLGRSLLVEGLGTLDRQGADRVKLEVRRGNDPARSLYRDLGFEHVRTARRYYDDGEDALVMVLDLSTGTGNL